MVVMSNDIEDNKFLSLSLQRSRDLVKMTCRKQNQFYKTLSSIHSAECMQYIRMWHVETDKYDCHIYCCCAYTACYSFYIQLPDGSYKKWRAETPFVGCFLLIKVHSNEFPGIQDIIT